MGLNSKKWTPVSMHKVVLAWLQAERRYFASYAEAAQIMPLLDSPDVFMRGTTGRMECVAYFIAFVRRGGSRPMPLIHPATRRAYCRVVKG